MSDNPLPAENVPAAPAAGTTPTWIWAAVGAVVLVALAAGGIAGFQYGRQYERSQGCPTCIYPDEIFWLLGASLVDGPGGVTVQHIASGGPAAAAGLHEGDRLIAVDDRPVNSADDGRKIIQDYGAGSQVSFTIERDHRVQQVSVTLGGVVRVFPPPIEPTIIFPPPVTVVPPPIPPYGFGERRLGVTYRMIKQGDPFGYNSGAMLIQVWPGGPAAQVGLIPGDIILTVDGRLLSESYTLENALNDTGYQPFVMLTVHKTSGETVTLRVPLIVGPIPYPEPLPYGGPQ